MTPKKMKKRLLITTTLVSAALGAAAPSAEAIVFPVSCASPPPFTGSVEPTFTGAPPFADSKFFPRGSPSPTECAKPPPFTPGFFPEPSECIKPPPGIEPV